MSYQILLLQQFLLLQSLVIPEGVSIQNGFIFLSPLFAFSIVQTASYRARRWLILERCSLFGIFVDTTMFCWDGGLVSGSDTIEA